MGRKPPVQPRHGVGELTREVMRDVRAALCGQRSVVGLSLCF